MVNGEHEIKHGAVRRHQKLETTINFKKITHFRSKILKIRKKITFNI